MRWTVHWAVAGAGLAMLAAVGCEIVAGLGDPRLIEGTGGAGASGSTGATSTASKGSTTSTASTTSTTTGMQGSGGGDAGMEVCKPGTTASFYKGEAGTENVGACKGGTSTCDADG